MPQDGRGMSRQRTLAYRAGGEQPANDGPAREDVRAEHLVGWMDHSTDVADEVTAQGLAVWGGQVLPLEPVLVPLLLAKPDLEGEEEQTGCGTTTHTQRLKKSGSETRTSGRTGLGCGAFILELPRFQSG